MVIFSSNTSYFSLYNYGLGHPTLCVNLSDSSGLDHSLGSRVIAVFSKRRCLPGITQVPIRCYAAQILPPTLCTDACCPREQLLPPDGWTMAIVTTHGIRPSKGVVGLPIPVSGLPRRPCTSAWRPRAQP